MITGTMNITFAAENELDLPILPFGRKVAIRMDASKPSEAVFHGEAVVKKATYRDKQQTMHNKNDKAEVQYHLEILRWTDA